jgi:hypothetical protein
MSPSAKKGLHSRYLRTDVEATIADAAAEVGVVVQYSTDIDRWSPVAIPARRRTTRLHRRHGRLAVHLVEHFFRIHGRAVWGRDFADDRAIAAFRRAAGIRAA